jgi:hypothetical protein
MLAMALPVEATSPMPELVAAEPPLASYLRGEGLALAKPCTGDRACFELAAALPGVDVPHLQKLVGAMGAVAQLATVASASCDPPLPEPASELVAIERTPSGTIEVGAPAWVFGGESPVVYFAIACRLRP